MEEIKIKPTFNIECFSGRYAYYVMHCRKKKDAETFCRYLDAMGRRWYDGSSYIDDSRYKEHNIGTAYDFNIGEVGVLSHYRSVGCYCLEFSDYDWSGFDDDIDSMINNIGDFESLLP